MEIVVQVVFHESHHGHLTVYPSTGNGRQITIRCLVLLLLAIWRLVTERFVYRDVLEARTISCIG